MGVLAHLNPGPKTPLTPQVVEGNGVEIGDCFLCLRGIHKEDTEGGPVGP